MTILIPIIVVAAIVLYIFTRGASSSDVYSAYGSAIRENGEVAGRYKTGK